MKRRIERTPTSLKSLSTDDVTRLCRKAVQGTDCVYLGTFSAWGGPDVRTWDQKTTTSDTAFVANTDVVEDEDTHWTLFYLPRDPAEPPSFFDTFGRDPEKMGRPLWRNYLRAIAYRRNGGRWERNKHRVQEEHTEVCGQLCCMALWLKARGQTLPKKYVPLENISGFLDFLNK